MSKFLYYQNIPKENIIKQLKDETIINVIKDCETIIRCTNLDTKYSIYTNETNYEEFSLPDSKLILRKFGKHGQLYYTGDVCLFSFKINPELPIHAQLHSLIYQYYNSCFFERSFNQILALIMKYNLYYPNVTENFIETLLKDTFTFYDVAEQLKIIHSALKHYENIDGPKLVKFNKVSKIYKSFDHNVNERCYDLIIKMNEQVDIKLIDRMLQIKSKDGSLRILNYKWTDDFLKKNKLKAQLMFDELMSFTKTPPDDEIRDNLEYPYEVLIIIDSCVDNL